MRGKKIRETDQKVDENSMKLLKLIRDCADSEASGHGRSLVEVGGHPS